MKQIGAVCMAASKQLLWKLVLIASAMSAAQAALFSGLQMEGRIHFGDRLQYAHIPKLFALAVILMALFIILQGGQFGGGKNSDTLRRLPISEWSITLLWALVYLICFVVLWAVQLTMIFVLWHMYCGAEVVSAPELELFVEFYAEPFLHTLLPLAEITRWLRMVLWLPAVSFSLSAFGFCHRRGKFRVEAMILLSVGLGFMGTGMGSAALDLAIMILSVVLIGSSAYGMWRISNEED